MHSSADVTDLLLRLNKMTRLFILKALGDMGITSQQLFVLREIICEPKTIGQISKALGLSYSTVSGIVDRLERESWVKRVRDSRDRRVVWIRITEKYGDTFKEKMKNFFEHFLQNISPKELETLTVSLMTAVDLLHKMTKT